MTDSYRGKDLWRASIRMRTIMALIFFFQGMSTILLHAQIVVDGTFQADMMPKSVGPGTLPFNKTITLSDGTTTTMTDHLISHDLGKVAGNNLFHSFSEFSVSAGKSATFTAPDSLQLQNVVSRVTGNNMSMISGLLASTIEGGANGGANLFLLNPNGILFGPNAALDIKGSLYASNANQLDIGGGIYDLATTAQQVEVLTAPSVEAFGFGSNPPAGSVAVTGLDTRGAPLVLIGRDVGNNATEGIEIRSGRLRSGGGMVSLISVGAPQPGEPSGNTIGRVPISNISDFRGATFSSLGKINIAEGARVVTGGTTGPGGLLIRGGKLTLDTALIETEQIREPDTPRNQPVVDLFLTESVKVKQNSAINVRNNASGAIGEISIVTGDFSIKNSAIDISVEPNPQSDASGPNLARGADLKVEAGRVDISEEGRIFGIVRGFGRGGTTSFNVTKLPDQTRLVGEDSMPPTNEVGKFVIQNDRSSITTDSLNDADGGNIKIEALSLEIKNKAKLTSRTRGTGKGGDIILTATNVQLSDGAQIVSDSIENGAGTAGNLTLNVDNLITSPGDNRVDLDERVDKNLTTGVLISSGSQENGQIGTPGTITIQGIQLPEDTGKPEVIEAASYISLTDTVIRTTLEGAGQTDKRGNITITADDVALQHNTAIEADTLGTGQAGTITFNVGQLTSNVQRTGTEHTIVTDSKGHPVAVTDVDTQPVTISSTGTSAGGDSGEIFLRGTAGAANPGANASEAATTVVLNRTDVNTSVSGDVAMSIGGTGGLIEMTTQALTLQNGTEIKSDTSAIGDAGSIMLNVETMTSIPGTLRIPIPRPDDPDRTTGVLISSSSGTTSTAPDASTGAAGTITIHGIQTAANDIDAASHVALVDTTARTTLRGEGIGVDNTSESRPANITITSEDIQLDNGTTIEADTEGIGQAGTITFNAGRLTANIQRAGTEHTIQLNANDQPLGLSGTAPVTISSTGTSAGGDSGIITIRGTAGAGKDPEGVADPNAAPPNLSNPATTVVLDNTLLNTQVAGNPGGKGGIIAAASNSVTLQNKTELNADTLGTGDAGDIILRVEALTALDSTISSNSELGDSTAGAAGSVMIRGVNGRANQVTLNDTTVQTTIKGGNSDTPEANITISANDLALNDGTKILADTQGQAPSGNIIINTNTFSTNSKGCVSDTDCSDNPAPVIISSSSTGENGSFADPTRSDGNAGSVIVSEPSSSAQITGRVNLTGAEMRTEALGNGQGGTIQLLSDEDITLTNTTLSANVHNRASNSDTAAASLTVITSKKLTIQGGGLTAQTTGSRNAGNVALNVGALSVNADEPATGATTEISSSSLGLMTTGNAGRVAIQGQDSTPTQTTSVAGNVQLTNTTLSTAAEGTGDGGSISVNTAQALTMKDTTVSANVAEGIDTPADSATGNIALTAANMQLMGGSITARTSGSRNAGQITLKTGSLTTEGSTKAVSLDSTNSNSATTGVLISSQSDTGSGNAGSVTITGRDGQSTEATTVTLNDTTVSTAAGGTGEGGPIDIATISGLTLENTTLSADVTNTATSDVTGAGISLTAPQLTMTGGSLTAKTTGSRNAGDVLLKVGALTVNEGASAGSTQTEISSSSTGEDTQTNRNDGRAGRITIQGQTANSLPTEVALTNTTLSTEASNNGAGGIITIGAAAGPGANGQAALRLTDTNITASVKDLTPEEVADPTLVADAADITLKSPATNITGGLIETETTGNRDAGNINLKTDALSTIGGVITSSSSGGGDAGVVIIEGQNSPVAGPVTLIGTTILSESTSTGDGGLIMIDADGDITLSNNTTISAKATGPGDAGSVDVTTTKVFESANSEITSEAFSGKGGSIKIAGLTKTVLDSTTVSAEVKDPNGEKIGGDITITGGQTNSRNPNFGNEQLLLRNGTEVSASSAGKGNAGTVELHTAGTLRLTQNSNVTTTATQASGGDIELNADFMIHLLNSSLESSVGGGDETTGGNIRLDPEFIIIQNSQILAQATAGTGGNIDLISNVFLRDAFSTIDATSSFGASGIITVASALQNLSGAIAPLPETIIQTATLYGEQCAAQKGGEFSSLSIRGRDRIPFEPGDYLLTPLLQNKSGDDLLQDPAPSSSPMASRLGLATFDTNPFDVLTSIEQGRISLEVFDGGCQS